MANEGGGGSVRIGNLLYPIKHSRHKEYVPAGFINRNEPPVIAEVVGTIKWMLQKDLLKQDIFLMGVPGYLRSQIVFQFLELANKEFEYLSLTRDSTEACIKQRRELHAGNAFYSDSCAVNAALNGRVLIIDGVERAERNVLPILNNLLENREMQLEDGRYLMAPSNYDKLLKDYTPAQLKELKLARVSEGFSVIAFGLPVPLFQGQPLDPPFRSRFQCRAVGPLPFDTMLSLTQMMAPNVDPQKLNNVLALAYGINSQQAKSGMMHSTDSSSSVVGHQSALTDFPLFPIDNLLKMAIIWNDCPSYSESQMLTLCYPIDTILKWDTQRPLFLDFLNKFSISATTTAPVKDNIKSTSNEFVSTPNIERLIADLLTTHAHSDLCLLGGKGSGKSALIQEFARRLNYSSNSIETVMLYQDMNRELLQQRRMLPNGDTVWEDGQLVKAAKEGHLCVLDGIERVHSSGLLEVLSPLIHHRFLQLPDGSRLVSRTYFESLIGEGMTEEELNKRHIFMISDRFRLVALGDANLTATSKRWLNDQLLSLFLFHTLHQKTIEEEAMIIVSRVPGACKNTMRRLLTFVHSLRNSTDSALCDVSGSLSLRRMIFIIKRHALNPNEDIYDAVNRAMLTRFMPALVREAVEMKMRNACIVPMRKSSGNGDGVTPIVMAEKTHKSGGVYVPDVLYYDNLQHSIILDGMARDFSLGAHLLLIGNQGTGKNKLTDRYHHLIQQPRQYIQLHRDTTIQSLTLQTTVVDGQLKYEDSPLVKAVREGMVLVVDEADKAPLHVIAVLKSLLDTGSLYLADGRRILPVGAISSGDKNTIVTKEGFRLIMLANRPGYPFAGNDLFNLLGDLFSVHVVDNPSAEEKLKMLMQYAPGVPKEILIRLVEVFSDLRDMSEQGELVHVAKHLQLFPDEQLEVAMSNVFDFDCYSRDALEEINRVLKKHGLSTTTTIVGQHNSISGSSSSQERIEIERNESDFDINKLGDPKTGKIDPNNAPHHGGNTWAGGTGGYNTAGLGGVGGPFRLDTGHDVHQMPDSVKQQIPEHILKRAREVSRAEYAKRLKEIEMSEHDAGAYNELYSRIAKQVKMLRSVVEALEAREHERQWAKNQTSGDFDDTKLIEGVTGEKAIYRRRVNQPPDPHAPQQKPKRLRLCFDVSASMYRFNGYDKRLQKSLETCLLAMEALEGKSDKIVYDIVGHSGDSPEISFVSSINSPPTNEKEKLNILKKMLAHTQYCMSGDYTLEAIQLAIDKLKSEGKDGGGVEADERIVIAISDANLDRYGISPAHLSKVLTSGETDGGGGGAGAVHCFLILIGSLGEQAIRLQRELPAGRVFVVSDAKELPQIMQKIFASTLAR